MVPALAIGFEDLKKRIEVQNRRAQQHRQKFEELSQLLKSKRNHLMNLTSSRLSKAETNQVNLSLRLSKLISKLQPLTLTRSKPLRAEEETLHNEIEKLFVDLCGKRQLTRFNQDLNANALISEGGRLSAKLNELWVLMARKKAARAVGHHDTVSESQNVEWAVVNYDNLDQMLEVLAQQQRSLDHLTQVLEVDFGSIDVIRAGFGLPSQSELTLSRPVS